jgi:uncharacterized protein (TIGR03083 family)
MPTELSTAAHLEGLRAATRALSRYAALAGAAASVPTRPGWTVRDLLVHQGTAHRWMTALLRDDAPGEVRPEAFERAGRRARDPVAWLEAGSAELLATIERAEPDAPAIVFLGDAPLPRAFWAWRACHDTTVHGVDALAAVLGRPPWPAETGIPTALALDGIDELLGGFGARPRSTLRCDEELVLHVVPDDAPDWWHVRVGPHPAAVTRRTRPGAEPGPDGDLELTGPAVELYLRLWDRTPAPAGFSGKSDRSEDCPGRRALASS